MKQMPLLCLLFLSLGTQAQTKVSYSGYPSLVWPKLYDIQYVKQTDASGEYEKPIFSKDVRALEGKLVSLPGYIVPFAAGTTKTKQFILTSLPLNACFFCGVGGPETVVEVYLKEPLSYTEKLIEVKGVLRLNDSNPDNMIYRLEQAEFAGEIEF
jgi:hypothetical protein